MRTDRGVSAIGWQDVTKAAAIRKRLTIPAMLVMAKLLGFRPTHLNTTP